MDKGILFFFLFIFFFFDRGNKFILVENARANQSTFVSWPWGRTKQGK